MNKINKNISKKDLVKIISNNEVFSGFGKDDTKQLNAIVSFRSVKSQEIIFHIDDPPNYIFYLVHGALTLNFPNNSKLVISPGDLIGEIGVLNGDFRLGRLVADENSQLVAICTKTLFDPKVISPSLSLEIIKRLSKRVTSYLRSIQNITSKEIILAGENDHVEFKSTLRWNLKAEKKDKRITHAVLKTISAFLNTEGGTLLVGVSDEGEILGLELDRFDNNDKLLLFMINIIKSNLGIIHLKNIHFHIEIISGKSVLRVDVQASNIPCYVMNGKHDHFYVRTGPSTTDLRLSEVHDFIIRRFL